MRKDLGQRFIKVTDDLVQGHGVLQLEEAQILCKIHRFNRNISKSETIRRNFLAACQPPYFAGKAIGYRIYASFEVKLSTKFSLPEEEWNEYVRTVLQNAAEYYASTLSEGNLKDFRDKD